MKVCLHHNNKKTDQSGLLENSHIRILIKYLLKLLGKLHWHCGSKRVWCVTCLLLQALQRASHIISDIRETHLWWSTSSIEKYKAPWTLYRPYIIIYAVRWLGTSNTTAPPTPPRKGTVSTNFSTELVYKALGNGQQADTQDESLLTGGFPWQKHLHLWNSAMLQNDPSHQ